MHITFDRSIQLDSTCLFYSGFFYMSLCNKWCTCKWTVTCSVHQSFYSCTISWSSCFNHLFGPTWYQYQPSCSFHLSYFRHYLNCIQGVPIVNSVCNSMFAMWIQLWPPIRWSRIRTRKKVNIYVNCFFHRSVQTRLRNQQQ